MAWCCSACCYSIALTRARQVSSHAYAVLDVREAEGHQLLQATDMGE